MSDKRNKITQRTLIFFSISNILQWEDKEQIKTVGALQKGCLWKFRKIDRKIPFPKSLFNKVRGWKSLIALKADTGTGVFLSILRNF